MKRKTIILIILLLFNPINIFAYSNRVAIGGDTIGIEVHSNGVYIVGFYDVNNKSIGQIAGFEVGDIIKEIDNKKVNNIDSLNKLIKEEKEYKFTIIRDNKKEYINMTLEYENNIMRTGLYVKDQINGIGTLSYIDPETKIYGSLGHEIIENNSFSKFEIKDGDIYKAEVSSIKKSNNKQAGEKNAIIDKNDKCGNIDLNETNGIFGKYTKDISDKEILEVGKKDEIKKGLATIRTVVNKDKVDEFKINIISLDENDTTKNIFFEIDDRKLLDKTGGIIQGMSGSPIIQNNKIIGVVNYVIVDQTKKGYGIFITTMLEEGDKIIN